MTSTLKKEIQKTANPYATKSSGMSNPFDQFNKVTQSADKLTVLTTALSDLLRRHVDNPAGLWAELESQGTPVILITQKTRPLEALLNKLGVAPGFITPVLGVSYRLMVEALLLLNIKPGLKTLEDFNQGLLFITPETDSPSFVAYQLYYWFAFKMGLPGFSPQAQRLFKTHWVQTGGNLPETITQLAPEAMAELKHAINREMEALRFVQHISQTLYLPRKQAKQLAYGQVVA